MPNANQPRSLALHPYLKYGGPLPATTAEEKLALVTPKVKREQYYQTLLENIIDAGHLYIAGTGWTDVSLEACHVEIKDVKHYSQAVGQLLRYAIMEPRAFLIVVLFGKMRDIDVLINFFRHTDIHYVFYFDDDDNLIPLYRSTGTVSPYFR